MSSDAKAKADECIQVVVRCRPLNKKELDEKRSSIIDIDVEARQVSIKNPDSPSDPPKYFTYDAAYDDKTQQKIFYDESCFSVIEGTLEGFNSTIFAYGQTGCGKSFTMQGPSTTVDELKGVIPNSFSHIFQFVKASKEMEVMVRCSYLELYNEEIKDLLSNAKPGGVKCELKEDPQKGVYVKGLTSVIAQSAEDLNAMLDRGLTARTTASTLMNAESSRSHSIFTIIVEMNTKDATTGKDMLRVGKLNLVDLAGSERQKKTGATDATLKEGIKINLSLSALGNVISALSEGSRHIPYRDSKLTRLLQDSLGGNTKTMMIAAISPADYNFEETMSTLRYANRAKNIKNKPKINEDPKDTMIREFKEEIERLRKLLAEKDSSGSSQALMASLLGSMGGGAGAQDEGSSVTVASLGVSSHKQQQDSTFSSPIKKPLVQEGDDDAYEYSPDKDHNSHIYNQTSIEEGESNKHAAALEKERALREDVESRLHQLEGMLGNNHEMAHSMKMASSLAASDTVHSELMSQPWAPTAEEIEEEEEAARNYERRRQEARKKKDAQQAREMQKMLEERKAMEEELEELRGSRASSSGAVATAGLKGTAPSANSSANAMPAVALAEVQDDVARRMRRMKKKYEKKLAEAKEALEDLQEDFSYQRRQFVEAATEQEKDLRLYELICQSVLSEKDLKRIIEKCRYDEETDEWIVPFAKKRSINESQLQGPGFPQLGSDHTNSPMNGGNNKMFPDINNAGGAGGVKSNIGGGSFQVQALATLRDPSKINGPNVGTKLKESSNARASPVPLLTLPGNVVTTASLVNSGNGNHSGSSGATKGGLHLPQISSRSDATSARAGIGSGNGYDQPGIVHSFGQLQVLPQQQPADKKKKSKSKAPKNPNSSGVGGAAGGGIGYGGLSSARSDAEYADVTDNDASGGSIAYQQYAAESKGEEGAGESAGPLTDWGFAHESSGSLPALNGKGGPEREYSDDEDFESTEDIISGSHFKQGMVQGEGPYPPAYGSDGQKPRKGKKKKKGSAGQHGEEYASSGGGAGKASLSLPPI